MGLPVSLDELDLQIDRTDCRVHIRTKAGPARLAIVDDQGNILDSDRVVDRIRDALIDALLDEFAPQLKAHSRPLTPPKPR